MKTKMLSHFLILGEFRLGLPVPTISQCEMNPVTVTMEDHMPRKGIVLQIWALVSAMEKAREKKLI